MLCKKNCPSAEDAVYLRGKLDGLTCFHRLVVKSWKDNFKKNGKNNEVHQ